MHLHTRHVAHWALFKSFPSATPQSIAAAAGCIFDMDGTLCKSVIDFRRMRQRLGILGNPIDLIEHCKSQPTEALRREAWGIIEDEERLVVYLGTAALPVAPC